MAKLTATQNALLGQLHKHLEGGISLPYENLKNLCEVKSFDKSFNALLFKGYVSRDRAKVNENAFKLTLYTR